MEVNNIFNFELIDSYYIKKLRRNNSDTADKLCLDLDINKSYLYSVENGQKKLSEIMFEKILIYYHDDYKKDDQLFFEAYDLTIKLYESLLFKNNELLAKYTNEFYEKENVFAHSRAFIFNDLISAISNLFDNKTSTISYMNEASHFLALYDGNILFIYAIIYAFSSNIYKDYKNVGKIIGDIYNRCPRDNIKSSIKGMLYYQIGKINECDKKPIEALKYFEKAIDEFKDIYCIERINQAKIEIAGIFLDLKLYVKAENWYFDALQEANKYNYQRRKIACLNNLAYLYFIQKKYDECEEYVYKAKEAKSTHPDLNYYLAYIAYLKQPKKQARLVVYELLKNEEDLYTQRMLKMIQGFINDNQKQIDSFFNKTKKYLEKFDDVIEIKELYKLNIVYYKDKNLERYLQLVEEYHNILGN